MGKKPIITAAEAAALVKDGDTITASGFVAIGLPESLNKAVEKRFLETGHPCNLLYFYAAAQGDKAGGGADHYAHKGMIRRVIGGHYNMAPKMGEAITKNEFEAYNLPQGSLSELFRDIAGHKAGHITHVGLNTFVDPRVEGGKLNEVTKEDYVKLIEIDGQEKLFFPAFPINVAFIRGTYADENGNVSLQKEACPIEATSQAAATHNSGGIVIVQVEKVVANGCLDPKLVKIPGIYVDYLVVAEDPQDQVQCSAIEGFTYDPAMSGEVVAPLAGMEFPPMSAKKIIGRRAALELQKNAVVNLGIGAPEYVAMVANEEGIGDWMTLTVEAGGIGGVSQGGNKFGGAVNAEALLDQPYQFDFYDGGGVDLAYLGLAEVDEAGNLNVSKFNGRVAGCGGFINITQNAKKVFFCGTFTAAGLKEKVEDGKLVVTQEGKQKKFIKKVEQITFSGDYAKKNGQPVTYITERAVFELRADGLYLTEIAPGIDLQTQVLDLMEFAPKMPEGGPKLMDARIFNDGLMGLK